MRNKQRILSFCLAIIMTISLCPITHLQSYAYTDVSSTLPFTFVKTGRVITLVKDYDDYYIMRETYAADGSYVENVVLQSITKTQYESELAKKEYDVHKVSEITTSINNKLINSAGGRLYFVNMISGANGNTTASFIGSLGAGYNNTIKISELSEQFGNPHSFLLDNNGRYFRGTTNSITGITTLVPLEQDIFDLLKMTMTKENISYLRTIKYWNSADGKAHFSDIITGESDIELFALVKNAEEIEASIQDILTGDEFIDDSEANENEAVDGFDSEKYDDNYREWSDNYNSGYQGQWNDPSYFGYMKLVEWADPFWSNNDIEVGTGLEVGGYYDDLGNWIPTDINGNPIPSVPGIFDSAGNFMPDGLNGYYDPDGVYHPLFDIEEDITISDNNIVIKNVGYFDRYGTWHEENKGLDIIYLYDGSIITPEGIYYDKENKLIDILPSDLWGTYNFGSWKIYPDGSIFDKSTNSLILNNGSKYEAVITEYGNYFFEDGTMIMKGTLAKGTKSGDNAIILSNGSVVYETNIIEYKNGVIYNSGTVILPSKETLTSNFKNGSIFLGDYGIIYENGHYADYNEYDNLITDTDAVIFNDGTAMLANGYIWSDSGFVQPAYLDRNLNVVTSTGTVYNRELKKGAYDENGEFIEGNEPQTAYYDALGNQIGTDGTVISKSLIGYYDENGTFVEGVSLTDGYYTSDRHFFSEDGQLTRATSTFGYKDENGYFVLYDNSGKYSSDGTYYGNVKKNGFHINSNGTLITPESSDFVLNMDGSISLLGESSLYYGNGLFKIKKNIGYYDEYGRFIIARENPYIIELGGFYDSTQTFHNESEIYIDNNGNWKLLYNPNLGLIIDNGLIGFKNRSETYSPDGLTTVDGNTGYYNENGIFIISDRSPFLGGFYDKVGTWIDKTYYMDSFGNLTVNNGAYIHNGNYITPSGDIGYFDESGEFILNKINPYGDGFYDADGTFHSDNFVYRDSLGLYKGFGEKFIVAPDEGGKSITNSDKSVKIGNYEVVYLGIFADEEGNLGVFNKDGKFIIDKNSYADGVYLPNGAFINFSEEAVTTGNMKFYGKDAILVNMNEGKYLLYFYDGYAIELRDEDGYYISDTGAIFSKDIKYCVKNMSETVPFDNALIENGFWINNKYFVDPQNDLGYFEKDGTFYTYEGNYGHYTSDMTFIEKHTNPFINGFYNFNGLWIGAKTEPNKGHFNNYGIPRNGKNSKLTGFFDHEGTWHENKQDVYIDINGNAHLINTNAVGYKDADGNTHIYGLDGYFNEDGTYFIGNVLKGHYNSTGELQDGKNQSLEGFYDNEGRWYQFGDTGYFDANGRYYEKINGELIGYYNSVGEFSEGFNPYLNGYYGFNGEWSNGSESPISIYYDIQGVKHVGTAPYYNGFYDMNGSWYFTGEKGFYDKNGTYYNITTQETGYYDALGIYYEGTNPYQHGYYDPNKNLHMFGQEGYYDSTGTYVDIKGQKFYYLNGGIRREGQNPNADGFFDYRGNWHEFNGDGYYDTEGTFHEYLLIISSFRVGSPDYILFEGVFENNDYISPKVKNTVQFSIFKDGLNTRYLDTGIKVSSNAMISYDKATDILHAISIYNDGVFIEDNQSCILIYEGSIINLKNEGKISIKELKDKFVDADIEIVVAKTRIGERYALTEAIETNKDIKVYNDGERVNLNYPLLVKDGHPYVAINDFKNLMVYDVKATSTDDGILLSFDLKDNTLGVKDAMESVMNGEAIIGQDVFPNSFVALVDDYNITAVYEGMNFSFRNVRPFLNIRLDNQNTGVLYMPARYIGMFCNKYVELDTLNYNLLLTTERDYSPVGDN